MKPGNFFAELRRRNVLRAAAFYAASAWLVVQVATQVFPFFHIAEWVVRWIVVAAIIGFPFALIFAWFYEWTPQGLQRESEVSPNESMTRHTGKKLDRWIIAILALTVVLLLTDKLVLSRDKSPGELRPAREKSIAVLPFENKSGDASLEYLSDGIAEALINSLTELRDLKVIARTSAFRYKGKAIDPQTVGRELHVSSLLMGSLRQTGETLNVQVDLVDTSNGAQLWGQEYERSPSKLVLVKQTIAREVMEKLRVSLSGGEASQLARRDTNNPEAYQSYLRGRYNWNKRTASGIKEAIAQFQQAITYDPSYALAYAGLADCYNVLEQYSGTPATETIPRARAAAERALQLDDSLAEAHTSLGYCFEAGWEWEKAEKEFKRAIELNPRYPTAHHWYQSYLRTVGRLDEAVAEIKRAQELDPLSSIFAVNLASVLMMKGDTDGALAESKRLVELNPNFPLAHEPLGKAYIRLGNYAEAIAAFEADLRIDRTSFCLGHLGHAYAIAGRKDDALKVLAELQDRYQRHEALGQYVACVYAGLGDLDRTFDWLDKDLQARSGMLEYAVSNSLFDSIRADSRYTALLRGMGLRR